MNLPEWFQGYRSGQQEAIDEAVEHYERGVPLVILDAPTGTGKTIIGESIRQRLETKGLYLCSSLTLQSQFCNDFDYAKDLRGRSNYLPHSRIGRFARATCADCDKQDVDGQVSCTFCDPVWTCPYEIAKREALGAELAVTNTRYFLTEANHVGKFSRLPFVILDECDVMEGELMNYIEVTVTNQMRKLLDLPAPRYKTKPESWVEWFQKVLPKVQKKLDQMAPTADDNLMHKRSYQAVLRLYGSLRRVAPEVADGGWVYCDYQNANITFKPVKVQKYGQQYLWQHGNRWLCMSASVISPEEFVDSLGWEGPWEVVSVPSPFDPKRRPICYAPVASMTYDQREQEWPKMAAAVGKVMEMFPDERVLVHTVSGALSQFLDAKLGPRTRTYENAKEREKAIAWFEETTDGVLLAHSLDRGYDGADDLTRVVVITKLPFPNIGDQQIRKILHSPGGGLWYGVQTARSLVQMAGRGMRHEEDWCKVLVLDQQFERFWREWRRGGVHRLLPSWFVDAIVWGGEYRRELGQG